MIAPTVAANEYQLLNGMLSGLVFGKGEESQETKSYYVSASGINSNSDSKEISIIPMRGTILKHDAECGPVGTRTLGRRLRAAEANPNVIAHVLICESGGGLAAAVPELSEVITSLNKPVVAWVDGMACSAAMYIISYCNEIVASRSTDLIGCIGTMIQLQGPKSFSTNQNGIVTARIYATESTEKNEDYEQALDGKFELIRTNMLDPINEQFVADMKKNRKGCTQEHLKGKTFFASDVVGSLVDSIGSLQYAIDRAAALANERKTNLKPKNKQQMPELTNLNAIESVQGFEMQDGTVSFNQDQLQAIETALYNGAIAATERNQLSGQVSERDATILQNNARITELETALAKGITAAANPAAAVVTECESTELSAMEICKEHNKMMK